MVTGLDHFRCLTGCLEELISMKNGNQEVSGDIVWPEGRVHEEPLVKWMRLPFTLPIDSKEDTGLDPTYCRVWNWGSPSRLERFSKNQYNMEKYETFRLVIRKVTNLLLKMTRSE